MTKEKQLKTLSIKIRKCENCKLRTVSNSPVPGQGDPDAKIIIIGEAPGREEAEQGVPFVGQSGKVLSTAITLSRLDKYSIWITNIVKCRPIDEEGMNRTPTQGEIASCAKFIRSEISIIHPNLIIPLGNTAFKTLNDYRRAISKSRGRIHKTKDGLTLFPTFHPAAACYKKELSSIIISDLVKARLYLSAIDTRKIFLD